jgi:hypothetical protein
VREVYRKRGRVIRREREHLVRVSEAGEAVDDGATFSVMPRETAHLLEIDSTAVNAAARAIEALVEPPLLLERMIVSEGSAEHVCNGVKWGENTRRVHVAIARPPIRVIVDLADFSLEIVGRVVAALRRAGGEREAPRHVRLAAHVGAALLPSFSPSKELTLHQSAAPHDGKGQPIRRRSVTAGRPTNWFRPSYRVRPVRAWFHLRAEAKGEIDGDLPEAIALLAPIEGHSLRVLCVHRSVAFPTVVAIGGVLAARPTDEWYPYAAGAFGAEIML